MGLVCRFFKQLLVIGEIIAGIPPTPGYPIQPHRTADAVGLSRNLHGCPRFRHDYSSHRYSPDFWAFLLGAVMPKNEGLVRELAEKTEDFVPTFLFTHFLRL